MNSTNLEIATLGGGCFWCVEACYQRLKGVKSVESGYAGGKSENPTYKEVCSGKSDHAEVTQVHFDPAVLSYEELLRVFFIIHDPTTLNRQGNDVGTQYRSVIFYHDTKQKETAEKVIKDVNETKYYSDPVVTEVSPFKKFYKAEEYHQNYFNENPEEGYCKYVVKSKVDKFLKLFKDKSQPPV